VGCRQDVPVWHEGTAPWVKEGELVLLGVAQEQHGDRCRLLAQWKGFDWPILHDPINVLELTGVPILVAIDEHGIVRSTRPKLATFAADFLDKTFGDDAKGKDAGRITPSWKEGARSPDWDALRARARQADAAATWRELGDVLALWGGDGRLEEAMDAYNRAVQLDPKDGPGLFRLGVCFRRRFESARRRPGDFQAAIASWGQALDLDPNQYIWRRRIQQYGPRLDKPYAFYDWVEAAEKDLRARGQKPVSLAVRPVGAEIAQPIKALAQPHEVRAPDPDGKVHRDTDELIRAEVTVAPARARPGQAVRVHVVLRVDPKKQAHWNNEAEPLRLWVDPPAGGQVSDRLLQAPAVQEPVSTEERALDFEVKLPREARDQVRLDAYALYHVCDDKGGQCRFLRLDIPMEVRTRAEVKPIQGERKDYRRAALDAGAWIRSAAIKMEKGTAWPAVPGDAQTIHTGLYEGVSGIVLYFLEAYYATKDEAALKEARAGADYLLAALEDEKATGLYVGLAGIGFTLQETFKATGAEPHRAGAKRCVQLLRQRAQKVGKGVQWNQVTDIISGSAGTGLFLLYAARELQDNAARNLALAAGHRLIELGQPASGGLKWAMSPRFDRLMPNFSHGTAGCAYFLATLYLETKDKAFLDAAFAGAKYLKAIAKTQGDVCLAFHHEPSGEDLFYLGWCHGPVGTARLFYRLYEATEDRAWLEWVKRSARAVMQSGIPEKRTPGFWNNVSVCCGSAGVAEFFLELYRITQDRPYLAFSRRVTDDLLGRATRDDKGVRWIQAEHRIQPNRLLAQTGYMQGAAGIGMMLLHFDAFERGQRGWIILPDNPFSSEATKND
jgi:rhamnogalacturonyl hydrolase YesR